MGRGDESGWVMGGIDVSLGGIREYGEKMARLGAELTGESGFDAAGNLTELGPVLGVIGAEVLAAFAAAQTNYLAAHGELAAWCTAAGSKARACAQRYEHADAETAAALRAAADRLAVL